MSERKVLNKYFPPDFDPSKLGKRRSGPRSRQLNTVRLMLPFSMRCNKCGEYIHTGKKFNARKEASGEFYLKIQIIRFYIRCPCCSAEISFKTDPKNADYEAEHGAHRPYKSNGYRLVEISEEKDKQEPNAMNVLEAKTEQSRREMEIQDALDDLRARNAKLDKIDPAQVLQREQLNLQLQDEVEAKLAFKRDSEGNLIRPNYNNTNTVHLKTKNMFKHSLVKGKKLKTPKIV